MRSCLSGWSSGSRRLRESPLVCPRRRCHDNIFVERLWRTVKYEEVYLHAYVDLVEARDGLRRYFGFYNDERAHQALAGLAPSAAYYASLAAQHTVGKAA